MARVMDQVEQATGANGVTPNVLTGRRFERAPFDSFARIFATGSAAGLETEINIGGRSVTQSVPLSTQNRIPIAPDDLLIEGIECYEGELIQITQRNTTAGALTGRYRIELEQALRAW